MSCEEIARTLDVPVGTVSSRLNRARRRIRHALRTNPSEATCAGELELAALKEKNLRWMTSN
jgi:hypothetical protein